MHLACGARTGGHLSFTNTDVPKDIHDYTTVSSSLTVPSLTIQDVNVIIHDLRHTWLEDLSIWIVSPTGISVTLFDRRGGSGDDLLGTVFDDDAWIAIWAGSAPFTGRFRPEQPLYVFNGSNAGGTWVLYVADLARWDQGKLNSWSLEIVGVPEPSTMALAAVGLITAGWLRRRWA